MIEIKYEKNDKGFIKTRCPFNKRNMAQDRIRNFYVGGSRCTRECKHFYNKDKANRIVKCSYNNGWFSVALNDIKHDKN